MVNHKMQYIHTYIYDRFTSSTLTHTQTYLNKFILIQLHSHFPHLTIHSIIPSETALTRVSLDALNLL